MKPQSQVDQFVQKISSDAGLRPSSLRPLLIMLTSALLVWLLDPFIQPMAAAPSARNSKP